MLLGEILTNSINNQLWEGMEYSKKEWTLDYYNMNKHNPWYWNLKRPSYLRNNLKKQGVR
jgi:hypothetical protein